MKRTWTSEELLEHFTLLPDELAAVGNKSGATRLGFAVLLKCFQYEGRFLRSRQEAAPEVVRFLATQVGVDPILFAQYTWEGRTIEAHRAQIREITKVREFRRVNEEALLTWLCTDILPHEQHPERLRELICTECRTRGIDVPDDITTLIETGFASYETQIYAIVMARLTPDALLRRFTRSNLQHPTYQGLHELGRVIKTIFLCDYLSDVRLRQDIQEALNVIEQWNSVNGFIFSARGEELLSNRPEDQEMALCLHLIQVSLALVNTLLLQEVLAEEKWKQAMKQEDWRGLTPLFYQHVNPYGRFTLDMTQRLPLSQTAIA